MFGTDDPIDPRIARAIKELLAKGLIVQEGERPDGTGVMRPAYRIADGVDRSKLLAILDALEEETKHTKAAAG